MGYLVQNLETKKPASINLHALGQPQKASYKHPHGVCRV